MMAVASTAIPLVSSTASPGTRPEERTTFPQSTSPSICPTTMGRSMPWVISVCPPQTVIPSCRAASSIERNTDSIRASVACSSGRMTEARKKRGVAPMAATSLALTWRGVPAGLVGGEGDRVGFGDHAAVPEADDRGVLADAGGNQQGARPHLAA